MSGLDQPDGAQIRKGAGSAVLAWVQESTPLDEAIRAEMEEFVVRRRKELGD